MTSEKRRKPYEPLAVQQLDQSGLHLKLEKGFKRGSYDVHVEFGELAAWIGFDDARRIARDYCVRLKGELDRLPDYTIGKIEDISLTSGPDRKTNLDAAILSFHLKTCNRRESDDAVEEQFKVACMRTAHSRDQEQAHAQTLRRNSRQEKFRERLDQLLKGDAYASIAPAVRERLLVEVSALAFLPRELGL